MHPLRITVTRTPSAENLDRLRAGLTVHSSAFVEQPGFQPLAVFAESDGGVVSGGAAGRINWSWLHVKLLWVAERARNRGLGSALLERLEAEGRARGCRDAHLDTFTYQALGFYQRHGYTEFGRLEGYPPGYSRVFLRKSLSGEEPRGPSRARATT